MNSISRISAFLLVVIPALLSCSGKSSAEGSDKNTSPLASYDGVYRIEGRITGAPVQQLYIQALPKRLPSGKPLMHIIDTAVVQADGFFVFEGKTTERQIAIILADNQHYRYFVLDGGSFEFNPDFQAFGNASVVNSKSTVILDQFLISLRTLSATFNNQMGNPDDALAGFRAFNDYLREFADTVSDPVLGHYAASYLDPSLEFSFLKSFLGKTREHFPGSGLNQELANRLSEQEVWIGRPAAEIHLPRPQGDSMRLSSLDHEVIMIDFWASWCMPCRQENPNLVRIYEKYKDKGFGIYSVSLDMRMPDWVGAIEKDKLNWPGHVSELKGWQGVQTKPYEVTSIPVTFLIDGNGMIIAKGLRGIALEAKLESLLGG